MSTAETVIVPPNCPECGRRMHKFGFLWAGRTRKQKYQCPGCGRTTIKTNGNGHSPGAIPNTVLARKPAEVIMDVAGGEISFKDKPLHICPVNLKPDANAQNCAYHNSAPYCSRLTYPFGCRLGLSKEDWQALPTS